MRVPIITPPPTRTYWTILDALCAAYATRIVLCAGVFLASNVSYNFSRGFFERVETDGSALVLLCWVVPGKSADYSIGMCADATESGGGCHSRIARTTLTDNTMVLCTEHRDAVHVVAEVYIDGITYKPSCPSIIQPAGVDSAAGDADFSLTEAEMSELLKAAL